MQYPVPLTAPCGPPAKRCLTLWVRSACLALCFLLAAGHFSPVHARGKPSSLARRREAKRLYNQGRLAYREGNYEEAILKWQESYRISGHPLIYTSIANAYERLGKYPQALAALSKYRKAAPRREHKTLDARLESLRDRVEREEREEKKRREERQKRELALKQAEQSREKAKQKRQREKQEARAATRQRLRWIGWPMAGTGAALVVTGVSLGAVAASRRVDPNEACNQSGNALLCSAASADDIRSSNQLATIGDALWISGSVLAVGGASLLFFALRDDGGEKENKSAASRSIQATVSPYGNSHGAGLMVVGRF